MSRTYWRVSPAFWGDEKVKGWSDDARMLALYLLTCPHRTAEGLFRLPIGYALTDLGWTAIRYQKGFDTLSDAGFAEYDAASEVCFIINALDYQAPEGPKQRTGAMNRLADLPKTPLFARLYQQALVFAPEFADTLSIGYPEAIDTQSIPPTPTLTPTPTPTPTLTRKRGRPAASDEDWQAFYEPYPKHQAPAPGKLALANALQKASLAEILTGLERQLPELLAREPQYVPLPATWLNQERWKDEPTGPRKTNVDRALALVAEQGGGT